MKGTSASHLLATGILIGDPQTGKPKWQSQGAQCDPASQTSCEYPQFRSGARVFEKFAYVRSPNVQRLFTFREELVPLIYGRDP
jgi:hypothetical protein